MADLPPDRFEQSPCFTQVGIGIFGPFIISEGTNTRRTNASKKVYGLVVICLVTRAIYIELVPDLDTSSFRNALHRFLS